MIQNKCDHLWRFSNDYIPHGGGPIQPIYVCDKCHSSLPASEVFQLESVKTQIETLNNLKGFQRKVAIVTITISIIALFTSIVAIIFK